MESIKNLLAFKENEIKTLNDQVVASSKVIEKTEKSLKEEQLNNEIKSKECEKLKSECLSLKTDIEKFHSVIEILRFEKTSILEKTKSKVEEVKLLTLKIENNDRNLEAVTKKLQDVENAKGTISLELTQEQNKVVTLNKELEIMESKDRINQRLIKNLKREKETLNVKLQRISGLYENQTEELKRGKKEQNSLNKVKNDLLDDFNKQSIQVKELKNDNKRLQVLLDESSKEVLKIRVELKTSKRTIMEHIKKIDALELELKQRDNIYESVCRERYALQKNLLEAKDGISDLKYKYKETCQNLEHIQDTIKTKEMQLLEQTIEREKAEKELENLKVKLQKTQEDWLNYQMNAEEKQNEELRSQKTISETAAEKIVYKKQVEQLKHERDMLDNKLVHLNGELSCLYKKINEVENLHRTGETQYNQRVEDIRLLRIEVNSLRQEKALLVQTLNNFKCTNKKVFNLERDLSQERVKSRTLEEELTNPLNFHRWRMLKAADPESYKFIQKLQLLQKRLLKKTAEVEEQEERLKEAKELNKAIQKKVEHFPESDAYVQLSDLQNSLQQQKRKNKALEAQLRMYKSQALDFKCNLELTNKELNMAKKNMLEKKKEIMRTKEKENATFPRGISSFHGRKCHYKGGGFQISAPAPI